MILNIHSIWMLSPWNNFVCEISNLTFLQTIFRIERIWKVSLQYEEIENGDKDMKRNSDMDDFNTNKN